MVDGARRFIGAPMLRREDRRLLTGGRYVADVVLAGMVHAAFVRSPIARGRILRIDTGPAVALDGVWRILTAADLNPLQVEYWHWTPGPQGPRPPWRALADQDVRYVGEPVALVLAGSRYLAEDAAELVEIEFERDVAVVGAGFAVGADAPIVHPELGSNIAQEIPGGNHPDLERAFNSAAYVVSDTIHHHRVVPLPLETRGMVAHYDPAAGDLKVVMSTQVVHETARFFARYVGLAETSVEVSAPDVGGGFGQKVYPMREDCCIVLATRLIGRPVKWIEDRSENLLTGSQSREESADVLVALDRDGTIEAMDVTHLDDVGAYPVSGTGSSAGMIQRLLTGPYKVRYSRMASRSAYTNTAGRAPYRGPWLMETVLREMMVDIVARRIGIDPLELRRRNVLHAEDMPYTNAGGFVYDGVTPAETLEQAAALIDYESFRRDQARSRSAGRYLGIGLGLYIEPTGASFDWLATEAATIRVLPGGSVQVSIGGVSQGHSLETTIAQVVAEHLGVPFEQVTVKQGDSATTPYGGGTQGSRSAVNLGSAARLAAEEMKAKVLAIAAEAMEASLDDLGLSDGVVTVRGTPGCRLSLAEVARIAYTVPAALPSGTSPGLEFTARYDGPLFTFSNACHACICEVDVETAKVTILRYVVSEDCGPMINPLVVDGQIDGGVAQGIGGALYEQMLYDEDGNPLTSTLADYLLPTASEVPMILHDHVATPAPGNPSGFKGMGEGGVIGATAAVANAVADALASLGVTLTRLPFGPRQLFDVMPTHRQGGLQ